MANLSVKDFDTNEKHLKATGAGTDGDPHIIEHEATQDTHDDLNVNANLQVEDADAGTAGNPVRTDPTGTTGQPVTNTGTFATQVDGAALTALQLIDDIVHTDDAAFGTATDKVAVIGAILDNVAPDSVDEGDAGALRMSALRELYIQIRDGAGNDRGLNIDASGRAGVTVENSPTVTAAQGTHDNLNLNANMQVGDADVGGGNPVPVDGSGATQPVSNAGTFAVQVDGDALTALQLIDDIIKTDDAAFTAATDKIAMIGAVLDDATPDSVDEGDAGALRMSANRALHAMIRDGAGNERGANVNASSQLEVSVENSPTVTPAQATHDNLNLNANLQVGDADVGGGNPVPVDGSGVTQPVSGSVAATNAGTFAVQEDGAALTALQLIDDVIKTDDAGFTPATDKVAMMGAQADETAPDSVDEGDAGALRMSTNRNLYVQIRDETEERSALVSASGYLRTSVESLPEATVKGTVAHDAADADAPVKIGAKAIDPGAAPTAVADDDVTDLYANRHGMLFGMNMHPLTQTIEYMSTGVQTNDVIIDAGSDRVAVTKCSATLQSTAAAGVRIGFDATTIPSEPTTGNTVADVILSHPAVEGGSGVVEGSGAGVIGLGAAGEDLRIACDAPTSGQWNVTVTYFILPA